MAKNEKTSPSIASVTSKGLSNPQRLTSTKIPHPDAIRNGKYMTATRPVPRDVVQPARLFDQVEFAELQLFAVQMNDLTGVRAEVPPMPTSKAFATPQSFNGVPAVSDAKNWCGQAACASIIKAWGRHGGKSDDTLMTEIYSTFPPDVLNGAWGTSPGRIVQILDAYGFKADWGQLGGWAAGGFLNPLNQPLWQSHRGHVEDQWVKAGFPVIILVDAGMINGPGWQPHWVPLATVASDSATICNAFDAAGCYANLQMPIDKFHEAWEIRFLPMLHFVVCYPNPR